MTTRTHRHRTPLFSDPDATERDGLGCSMASPYFEGADATERRAERDDDEREPGSLFDPYSYGREP